MGVKQQDGEKYFNFCRLLEKNYISRVFNFANLRYLNFLRVFKITKFYTREILYLCIIKITCMICLTHFSTNHY